MCQFLIQTSMDSMHYTSVSLHKECGQNNFDLVNNALSRERSRNSALGASQGVDNAGDEIDSDDDQEIGICLFPLFSFFFPSFLLPVLDVCTSLLNYLLSCCICSTMKWPSIS